jgi:hypothetical protein
MLCILIGAGFPKMLMSAYNEDICILVEELLGMNLESLRKKYSKLSLAVISSIGIQLVSYSHAITIID